MAGTRTILFCIFYHIASPGGHLIDSLSNIGRMSDYHFILASLKSNSVC